MANPTDDPTENTPVSTGSSIDGNAETEESPDERKYDHTDEVPALLGIVEGSVDKEQVIVPDQEEAVHDAAPAEVVDAGDEAAVNAEAKAAEATTAMDSFQVQPESPIIPEITIAQENRDEVLPADVADLKDIMAALQESLTNSRYISAKIDAVSIDTDCLIKQVNGISNSGDLLAAEIEAINSGAKTKSILSKTFLTCSSAVLALLIIIQFYMFISLIKTQRLQNTAGSSVLENISRLDKRMAAYDKISTKALENPVQQAHVQPVPAAAEKVGHAAPESKEENPAKAAPVLERLNKLRSGLPEKKLFRKETGDWFVYNKKPEECISDVEVIEALNQAYKRSGRSLTTNIPMPAYKALCVLKPDGKGGTEVVMTKEFLPL